MILWQADGEVKMPKREDKFQALVFDFIVKPAVVLLGIFLAGVFVETLFNFASATKYLFLGIGGIGFLIYYFRKKIGEL